MKRHLCPKNAWNISVFLMNLLSMISNKTKPNKKKRKFTYSKNNEAY